MSFRACIFLTLLVCAPFVCLAQVDARAEVAAALYAASATQAAAEKFADAKLSTQRSEIEGLRAQVRTGTAESAQLRASLTAAQEKYVSDLAARDRAYGEEIAVFRSAVQDIAAMPEGASALARFNSGEELGALAILDNLRKARDTARKKRADIESAAEGRRIHPSRGAVRSLFDDASPVPRRVQRSMSLRAAAASLERTLVSAATNTAENANPSIEAAGRIR